MLHWWVLTVPCKCCRDFEEHTKTNAKSVKEMQALADSYDKAVVEVCNASVSSRFPCLVCHHS